MNLSSHSIIRTSVTFVFVALTLFPFRIGAMRSSPVQDEDTPLVINEVLARVPDDDPATEEIEGDANGDGVRNATDEEFVEFINIGEEPLDVSGFVVFDNRGVEMGFTFPPGTIIPPREALLLFGGGDLNMSDLEFGNAGALGLVFTAGGRIGNGLANSGDEVVVVDPMGKEVVSFAYDHESPVSQSRLQSFNRNPDVTGEFDNHLQVQGAGERSFSPGTLIDGRAFRRAVATLTPANGPVGGGNVVTVEGLGFGAQVTSVSFGGVEASEILRVSPLQLQLTVPAGMMEGPVDVVVTDEWGRLLAANAYTYSP